MKLVASAKISNSNSESRLRFTTTGGGSWKVWDRYLALDERQLVHLGNVCGTCEFFFRHIAEPPLDGCDLDAVRGQLERGLENLEPVIDKFRSVLPNGEFVACLFEGSLAKAGSSKTCPDYFSAEQSEVWARDAQETVTGLSDYYRGDSVGIAETEKLFEFVVPLVSRERLQSSRVEHYVRLLESGAKPTAVAISVLDVKSSMDWPEDDHGNEIEPEYPTHWCFAHYLIDGHHKVAAAAESGQMISVLSFIALEPSWLQVDDLLEKYKAGLRP